MIDINNQGFYVHSLALCESDNVGCGTRIWAYAHVMKGSRIGEHCNIGDHAFIECGAIIGNRVTIKNQVVIWDGVTVEDDVFLGPRVAFTNDRYPRSPRLSGVQYVKERYESKSNWILHTTVKQGASIGAAAVISPGIIIGKYSMIGMGSVVCDDVPDHALVVGNPARRIAWICMCGQKLKPDMSTCDIFDIKCSCGLRYEITKDGVNQLKG